MYSIDLSLSAVWKVIVDWVMTANQNNNVVVKKNLNNERKDGELKGFGSGQEIVFLRYNW